MIQQAIESNYDLKIAGERIRAAHDLVRVAASGALPQVGLGAAAESRRETQTIDWPPASPKYGEYPYYALGFDASWELDLFGEVKRRKESAQAAADAAVRFTRCFNMRASCGAWVSIVLRAFTPEGDSRRM